MTKNLKIGTRLMLGFSIILLMTTLIGWVGISGINQLSDVVTEIYDHPVVVSNAVRDIKIDVLSAQINLRNMLRDELLEQIQAHITEINHFKLKAENAFSAVFKGYLGEQRDVEQAYEAYQLWSASLDELIELALNNHRDEAERIIYREERMELMLLNQRIQVLVDFANAKVNDFYRSSQKTQEDLAYRMLMLLIVVLLATAALSVFIARSITVPMVSIVKTMKSIAKGDLSKNIEIYRTDEVGTLADSFRELIHNIKRKVEMTEQIAEGNLDSLIETDTEKDQLALAMNKMVISLRKAVTENKQQTWLKLGKEQLSDVLRGEKELSILSREIIIFLAKYLNCQIGAFYTYNKADKRLSLMAGYAFNHRKHLTNSIGLGEGLVGQAGLEQTIITVDNLPDDYVRINSAIGDTLPTNTVVIPFMLNMELKGVIELGSLRSFTELQTEFLELSMEGIAIAINSVQIREQLQALLESTRKQAEILEQQSVELQASNSELEEQAASLKSSEERLKIQQEELQATNEELEEKTEYLEKQKREIEETNSKLSKAANEINEKARELEQSNRYKSEFLANMSHELRTPLNSLILLSRSLLENRTGNLDAEQVESCTIIYNSGNELLNLINDILDLSKIEAGQMQAEYQDISLQNIIEAAIGNFSQIAKEKDLQFNTTLGEEVPETFISDYKRVNQIVKNLLSNAMKFTAEGAVTLAIQLTDRNYQFDNNEIVKGRGIAISVTDTGVGIPNDKQTIIFEAFQQVDGSTARTYGGTGLGLSICRELSRLLSGGITLSSQPGEGSTFTLILPLDGEKSTVLPDQKGQKPPAPEKSAHETTNHIEYTSAHPTHFQLDDDRDNIGSDDTVILIVEDDKNFANILIAKSRAYGFKALAADNGELGLKLAMEYLPTAILLDNILPGISGLQVLDILKHTAETRHIPVHFMTVSDIENDVSYRGAIGYLQKPISKEELERAFERLNLFSHKRIKDLLLVEDDVNARLGIKKLIGNGDVKLTVVGTGEEAITAITEGIFDCMVLDLGLPDMSGFELLERLDHTDGIQVPPTIIYTGRELSKAEVEKLREFSDSIIIKGVKSEERLLDETALFLHRVVGNLPKPKQQIIQQLRNENNTFQDKVILVADDDMRSVFALSKILREEGMTVIKAEDGFKALKMLEEHPEIDLVLMDIMMPQLDGYDATRKIREDAAHKNLPIIALTAKAMKEDRAKCITAGANDYLSKPIDVGRLFSMLRVWLHRDTSLA